MSPGIVALVALGGVALVGSAVVVARAVNVFWQGDARWGRERLGNGSSTIADGGCLLSLFTMAANTLLKQNLNPLQVNEILKAAGAFIGSNLVADKAALALGLAVRPDRVRQVLDEKTGEPTSTPTTTQIRKVVDAALNAGGLAVLHVAHTPGVSVGQHFVLINGRNKDGSYTAADPAPGRIVTLDKALGGRVKWGSVEKIYRARAAFGLVKKKG